MSSAAEKNEMYGLMAEFTEAEELITATEKTRHEGYTHFDAFTPFPMEELSEAMGEHHSRVPLVCLIGGIVGLIGGYALCYWTSVIDYPINVGGRAFHSWPAFIPVTFECTILIAGLSAVLGMLALNGLPMPHHPVFNVPRFALASRDRFFLCIESTDPKFDATATRGFLQRVGAREVFQVDPD